MKRGGTQSGELRAHGRTWSRNDHVPTGRKRFERGCRRRAVRWNVGRRLRRAALSRGPDTAIRRRAGESRQELQPLRGSPSSTGLLLGRKCAQCSARRAEIVIANLVRPDVYGDGHEDGLRKRGWRSLGHASTVGRGVRIVAATTHQYTSSRMRSRPARSNRSSQKRRNAAAGPFAEGVHRSISS